MKLYPLMEARNQKEAAIVKETIALLQQKLGDADFKKLDAYIFEIGRGGSPWTVLKTGNPCSDKCNPIACHLPNSTAATN
jgi:hypothetical protein